MKTISSGTVHALPNDVRHMLSVNIDSWNAWESCTALARNEWICWIENAKLIETRKRRILRAQIELAEGKRRPCCWIGCIHRTDKAISPSVQWVLERKKAKSTP